MEWLNYHHLLYFWTVVREGGVGPAAKKLHLSQPTVSGQLRTLEHSLGEKLFEKKGRRLALTDVGQLVYRYAEEIFSLGGELQDALRGRPTGRPMRLTVGVVDGLAKVIAYKLLEPALRLDRPVSLTCYEDKLETLLAQLSTHGLDLVLSDAPVDTSFNVRAFNHLLGECGVSFFAAKPLARKVARGFPKSLGSVPMLLPTRHWVLRRSLEQWFSAIGLRPNVAAEFQDVALMTAFGAQGEGVFPGPSVIEADLTRLQGLEVVGAAPVRERFYAISAERRLVHPAVLKLTETARAELFT